MILKRIFFIGFLFPISLLNAQTDFRPGYVVTNSNDTLYGEIDYRGDKLMGQICKFRSNESNIAEYTPYDIAAYRFPDSKYYVSREVSGKRVFLEFLIKGEVNIYYLRDEIGNRYFIDKEGMSLAEMPYEEGIREVNKNKYSYTSRSHLGILLYYMQDAPDVVQKQITKLKKPEHNSLIKLAEDYHYAVCMDGAQCIIFEKKSPLVKLSAVNVTAGMLYDAGESSFTGGVLLNLWMPRINEKVYMRTGLLYQEKEIPNVGVSRYKIPLMLEYIYPKSIIRPKFAYGWSVYTFKPKMMSPATYSVTCMGGFNISLNSSIGFSLEYNAEFIPFMAFFTTFPSEFPKPKLFISQSFLGGLYFKF